MKVLKHCILKTSVFFTLFLAASVTSKTCAGKYLYLDFLSPHEIYDKVVVIDAGHGGPDAGAVGRLYKEKDINLDVALRFGRMISEHYPDVLLCRPEACEDFVRAHSDHGGADVVIACPGRLWDLESKEKCCRILLTLQSRASLFFGKAAAALLQIFLMVAAESAGILALGKWAGYTDALDFGQFWWLAAATFTVNAMLFFLWLFLSVRFDNQVPTLAGGMVGSLSGLFASFMPPMVSFFMPWGYYIPLSTARMDWDPETRIVRYYTAPYPVWLLGVTIALCVLFAVMTWNALKRKEV